MLRKDFIFHQLQVMETASTPASALLLIVRLTPDARELRVLREQAEAYGMQAVVEIFDEGDLALARESGARIIQVNARDLDTLETDRQACLRPGETPPGRGSVDSRQRHERRGASQGSRGSGLPGRIDGHSPDGRRKAG
ncbi:MAG: hypothetical protein ACLU7D_09240 [Collinsella sp.]